MALEAGPLESEKVEAAQVKDDLLDIRFLD